MYLRESWDQMVNNKSLIYEMRFQVPPELFTTQFEPQVTMLVTINSPLPMSNYKIGLFQFKSGNNSFFPLRPNLSIQEKDYSLKINWSDDPNAVSFKIYRGASPNIDTSNTNNFIQNVSISEYEDANVIPGKRYYYKIIPVMDDGSDGPVSNEVNGVARAKFFINLDASNPKEFVIGDQFSLTGNVQNVSDASFVVNPVTSIAIDKLGYKTENRTGSAGGTFDDTTQAPMIPGNYDYTINASSNIASQSKTFSLKVKDDPNKGHDLAIEAMQLNSKLKLPGESITGSFKVKSYGAFAENDSVLIGLYDKQNNLINSKYVSFSLTKGDSLTNQFTVSLPVDLTPGDYCIKASINNIRDYNRLNNKQAVTFNVSIVADQPCYRLISALFDSLYQSIQIEGYNIVLTSVNDIYVEFNVNGNGTSFLGSNSVWQSSSGSFMLIPDQINDINDSTFTISIRAGGIHNDLSFSPYHVVGKKLTAQSFNIIGPSGSNLNTNIDFLRDPDALTLKTWVGNNVSKISNNNLQVSLTIPDTETKDYFSFVKIIDNGLNYWWVKRLYVTPIASHDAKFAGSLLFTNITANGEPGDFVGDRFKVTGVFQNIGEFSENLPVRMYVIDEGSDVIWVQNQNLTLNPGTQGNFEFDFPTLGLQSGNYGIFIDSNEPEDANLNDNSANSSIHIDSTRKLNCQLLSFNPYYNVGDTIKINANVSFDNTVIMDADSQCEITTPTGEIINKDLNYDPSTSQYKGFVIATIGGNYYFKLKAYARRFKANYATGMAQVKAHLYIDKIGGQSKKGDIQNINIGMSSVGDIYAIAGQLQYGNRLYFKKCIEGNIINQNGEFKTSFNYSDKSGRLIIGITKLNSKEKRSINYQENSVLAASFLVKSEGTSDIFVDNIELFDSKGNKILADCNPLTISNSVDTTLFKTSSYDSTYFVGDTLLTSFSALNKNNIKSVSFDVRYDTSKIKYLFAKFDSSISDYGEVNQIQNISIIQPGNLTVGISRAGNLGEGTNSSVLKFADIYFLVKKQGKVETQASNIHVISPFKDIEYPVQQYTDSIITSGINTSIGINFSQDTLGLCADDTAIVPIYMSHYRNGFASSIILNYDTNAISILKLTEGNLFNENNSPTSFLTKIDSLNGQINCAISKLGLKINSVDTATAKTLINIKIKKKGYSDGFINVNKFHLIDNLGNSYTSLDNPSIIFKCNGIVSYSFAVDSSWNMVSIPLLKSDMSKANLFPDAISPAYGYENGYLTKDTLLNGAGYWLQFGKGKNISLQGTMLSDDTIMVKKGWNMIGPQNEDWLVSMIKSSPTNIVSSNYWGFNNGYENDTLLQIGKGYWIQASQDGKLYLNNSTPKVIANTGLEIKNNWPHIKVNDNSGRSRTLYFSKDNININKYQLPPKPPSDIFDVRFFSSRFVEMYDHSFHSIITQGLKYPVSIEAYGANFHIKTDNGKKSADYYINQGTSISINNTDLNNFGIDVVNIPLSYMLYQNYPNPFNPSTKIRYEIPKESFVTIKIYDVLGREVSTLVNEQKSAGYYNIEFNANNLASGIYFYRIQAGDFVRTKKLILLK